MILAVWVLADVRLASREKLTMFLLISTPSNSVGCYTLNFALLFRVSTTTVRAHPVMMLIHYIVLLLSASQD